MFVKESVFFELLSFLCLFLEDWYDYLEIFQLFNPGPLFLYISGLALH